MMLNRIQILWLKLLLMILRDENSSSVCLCHYWWYFFLAILVSRLYCNVITSGVIHYDSRLGSDCRIIAAKDARWQVRA